MKNCIYYDSPIGRLGIAEENNEICLITFDDLPEGCRIKETPLLKKAVYELDEYFNCGRKSFDLPLSLKGTDFQIKVWYELMNIPYGKTMSYGELAEKVGNKRACRAVGMANNKNPIPIIIPCHRVIGKNGSLTGYAGGLNKKQFLLKLENN